MIYIKKLIYLFLPLLSGSIIGLIISNSIDYDLLIKPAFSPPGYLFPIIWAILYLLMGISYYLLKNRSTNTIKESKIYYVQLIVNLLWSIFFFVLKWRLFTIVWTVLLLILVIYMIFIFYKKNKISAYLNIPYLLWLIFATYLTIGTYILN